MSRTDRGPTRRWDRKVALDTLRRGMSGEDGAAHDRASWKELALVAGLALAALANTFANQIVYDDRVLLENPALRAPFDLPGLWTSTWWGEAKPGTALYRPLASWSLGVNGWLNERCGLPFESVTGFHVANALFHAAVSVLVLSFLRVLGLSRAAACIGAALFAVLAIHVEALAPITGRSETLALGFGLGFVLLHARRTPAWLASACFLAALLCKESAAGFLAVAFGLDLLVKRERPEWTRVLFALGALAVFLAARWSAVHGAVAPYSVIDNPLVAASTLERVLTACAVQLDYLRLMLVPAGFASDASLAQLEVAHGVGDARVPVFVLVAAGLVALSVRAWPRDRAVAFSVIGYAALFAPASNVLFLVGTARAERLAYAPSLFVCALLGLGIARVLRWKRALGLVLAALFVAVNLAASWSRNAVWRDPATFFRAQVVEAPRSAKARFNLGAQLAAEGDDAGAEREYQAALALHPDYAEVLHNHANLLRRRGEAERALGLYRRALELQPLFLPAAFGVVEALHDLRRDDEARAVLAQIEKKAPRHPWLAAHRALLGR